MDLCQEQIDFIPWFVDSTERVNVLTGYAGSGKTTVMKALSEAIGDKGVIWCSYSHQAKNILNRFLEVDISLTVASALGLGPDGVGGFGPKYKNKLDGAKYAIFDESSMINESQKQWILKSDIEKILFVGDVGQVPPVGMTTCPVFTDKFAKYELQEIHRQSKDSPILEFATDVRMTGGKDPHKHGIMTVDHNTNNIANFYTDYPDGVAICPTHAVKNQCNQIARFIVNGDESGDYFVKGEMLFLESSICPPNGPKNGDRVKIIDTPQKVMFDGRMLWEMTVTGDHKIYVPEEGVRKQIVYSLMEYRREYKRATSKRQKEIKSIIQNITDNVIFASHGFGLTIHKSQGSTFEDVLFCTTGMQTFHADIRSKMAYTAVTRASRNLILCG